MSCYNGYPCHTSDLRKIPKRVEVSKFSKFSKSRVAVWGLSLSHPPHHHESYSACSHWSFSLSSTFGTLVPNCALHSLALRHHKVSKFCCLTIHILNVLHTLYIKKYFSRNPV